ncbi:hypothetical protein [Burkholderia sp. Z1]|uniref:hypothetical protein n=1 Tax=Burkholderia sp. Z1 TaxID=2759039 RepID=UPI0018663F79|nr:hypothetical protein [Burkholderia sp. Z1]
MEQKQQLAEAAFSNHTPMMQQYLFTSPDERANEVQGDHVHPDGMAANYGAGTHRNTLPPTAR